MGQVRIPHKVLLLTAVCYNPTINPELAEQKLTSQFGPIKQKSEPFTFDHTRYYQNEMGIHLKKYYITFSELICPENIADIKLYTNAIEDEYTNSGARNINLDPGYIEVPKLVLATTKNFSHRIYLHKGIYGDVQLYWQNGTFNPNPWTYPDYTVPENLLFFNQQRQSYFKSIQKESQ